MKQFKNLTDFTDTFKSEIECIKFLSDIRWNGSPVCVHCGHSDKIYTVADGKLYKCSSCRKQFSVKIGTIFEDSALPLQKWFMAIYILMAHKKGISSIQLGKDVGVTQKTAWFMMHRIRYAVRTKSFEKPLTGIIEADETFIGGEEKNKHFDKKDKESKGRSAKTKTPVFGIRQRDGVVVAQTLKRLSKREIDAILKEQIHHDATIMTDDWTGYKDLDVDFLHHYSVNHSAKEYVRGKIHTNSIESFWALLKRGIFGIYHQVSKKHLDKYVDEFEFRFNSRKMKDNARLELMLQSCAGRMMYKDLIQKK